MGRMTPKGYPIGSLAGTNPGLPQKLLRSLLQPRLLGHLLGIPIKVAPAVWLMVAFALLSGSKNSSAQTIGIAALLLILLVALLVHELAHALVAKKLGLHVLDITIWPLGGAARMEGLTGQSKQEAMVAAAGPFANIVLGGICMLLPGAIAADAAWINLVLGLGNLIPAFPLDGGRILRAWLARRSPLVDATHAANRLSRLLAVIALLFCFIYGALLIGLILAVYLWWSGQMEYFQVVMREGHGPTLPTTEVWRRACYPFFSSVGHGGEAKNSKEDLENFHGSLDDFFRDRNSK